MPSLAQSTELKMLRPSQAKVVFLVNFVSPNLVEVLRQVQQRAGSLHILASVPMESNRQWKPDSADLNVIQQRTWTRRREVVHPGGYTEQQFIHIPLDTLRVLRRLRPDCVVSLEMGMRSLQASFYRRTHRGRCAHVLAVYGSQRSEAGRGPVRRWLRRRLLAAADIITYNGPSCRRYLLEQGARAQRLRPWDYACDPRKVYRGEIAPVAAGPLRLLSVGQLVDRKGTLPAARAVRSWAAAHPERAVEWSIAGTGPESAQIERLDLPPNLQIRLLGHCEPAQLQELYRDIPVALFPTLGDEWGLVVDEALGSGQLVLGSVHSQAVETLVRDGENGWQFDPERPETLAAALDRLAGASAEQIAAMRARARESVAARTPVESAEQFIAAVAAALESRAQV